MMLKKEKMKFILIFHEKSFVFDDDEKEEWGDVILLHDDKTAEYWMRGVSRARAEIVTKALNSYFGYES